MTTVTAVLYNSDAAVSSVCTRLLPVLSTVPSLLCCEHWQAGETMRQTGNFRQLRSRKQRSYSTATVLCVA